MAKRDWLELALEQGIRAGTAPPGLLLLLLPMLMLI